ncbi:MAG: HyaD/HybD family hydrogenase maturation endopeptidase [Dehalococcoidales bacterium]|nr:HyaD/HybD family hydrogenase maturation endopeptidase [Dehalococcoidales bacterium]
MKKTANRCVVIGVGNLLMKDDGVGIHAVQALQELALPQEVTIIDGGTSPDLIALSRAGDKLIIIDAARAGGAPGAIYRFTPDDLDPRAGRLLSLHEFGVKESLQTMRLAKTAPAETVIIGVEPKEIDWGMELSPEVKEKLPEIVKAVLREIEARES